MDRGLCRGLNQSDHLIQGTVIVKYLKLSNGAEKGQIRKLIPFKVNKSTGEYEKRICSGHRVSESQNIHDCFGVLILIFVRAGVIGLNVALVLCEKGYSQYITIIAEHLPGDTSINYTSPWYVGLLLPVHIQTTNPNSGLVPISLLFLQATQMRCGGTKLDICIFSILLPRMARMHL